MELLPKPPDINNNVPPTHRETYIQLMNHIYMYIKCQRQKKANGSNMKRVFLQYYLIISDFIGIIFQQSLARDTNRIIIAVSLP